MSFERFISIRYLLSREHKALVSIITAISILGVALGVTALIVVIAVMDGFDNELLTKIMSVFSDVEVWGAVPGGIPNHQEIIGQIEHVPGVVAAAPVISRQALLQPSTGIEAAKVGIEFRGFDPDREKQVSNLMNKVVAGNGLPGKREVVLGIQLARRLGIWVGDSVYAITMLAKTAHGPIPKVARLRVTGIFESGLFDIDANFAYASLQTLRDIFLLDDIVDFIHVKIKDPMAVGTVKRQLEEAVPGIYNIRGWNEINPDFFKALRLEKLAMFIILLLIVVVAAFGIVSTLIMLTTQKTREIGMLKSMGANNRSILKIFLYHGVAIGAVGTSLGVAAGLFLCFLLHNYIHYDLPEAIYGLDRLPVDVQPLTIFIIIVSSLAICVLASIVPAYQASRLNPVEALRYE